MTNTSGNTEKTKEKSIYCVKKMSDEELRVEVAKLCGWRYVNPNDWRAELEKQGIYAYREHAMTNAAMKLKMYAFAHDVPNYPADLNAMHEAEKVLTDEQHKKFRWELRCIIAIGASTITELEKDDRAFTSATARQRAEAFVSTLQQV